jgi:hypothetical protein
MTTSDDLLRDQLAAEYCNDSEKEFMYLFKAGWNAAMKSTDSASTQRDVLLCENELLKDTVVRLQAQLERGEK